MPKCLPAHCSSRAWNLRKGAPHPLSPAPGPSRMPRYLAWPRMLMSCVMGRPGGAPPQRPPCCAG
eukprot:1080227-Alexandrium_andersonii.AAC.1